jgi:hypothetical protein
MENIRKKEYLFTIIDNFFIDRIYNFYIINSGNKN